MMSTKDIRSMSLVRIVFEIVSLLLNLEFQYRSDKQNLKIEHQTVLERFR